MIINVFDEWKRDFFNAKKFFESKGNSNTLSKLKDKWYKEFFNIFEKIEEELRKGDEK